MCPFLRNVYFYNILRETANIFSHDVLEIYNDKIPAETTIIPSQFVLTVKRSNEIKARWVAAETNSITPSSIENYAATVSQNLLFLLLTFACAFGWDISICDIASAFLHGCLKNFVFLKGAFPMNNIIFKVYGNLYGLKAAPKTWFIMICSILLYLGYTQSIIDDCLFFLKGQLYIIIFVDDIFLTGTKRAIENFLLRLKNLFKMTVETKNELDFLGVNITITPNAFYVSQKSAILKHSEVFNVTIQRKPCVTTFAPYKDLNLESEENNVTSLQKIVGVLSYLVRTRPDVAYHVNQLQCVSHIAREFHIDAAKYLFGYILGSVNDCLLFNRKKSGFKIELFVDASQRQNFSAGYAIFINDNLFSFKSKLFHEDKILSGSSCYAEACALELGFQQLLFLLNIFEDLQINLITKPQIFSDSKGLIQFLHKNSSTTNISSWELKFHVMKRKIRDRCTFQHIDGTKNPADIFTKTLPVTKFNFMKDMYLTSYNPGV